MISLTQDGGLWRLTLNRPDKANALTPDMLQAVGEAAQKAHQDPEFRALVLTGAGDRVFCAGADVDASGDMLEFTRDPVWAFASNALNALPGLTIAALNGTLAGGGFALALACDLRIATPNAKFFYPVLKRGYMPQPNDVQRLVSLIGPAQAKLLLMGGQKFDADLACALGLIDRVVPAVEFDATLAALTQDVLAAKPQTVYAIKRMFAKDLSPADLDECYKAAYFDDPAAIARIKGP